MIENYSKTKSLLYKLLGQVANKRINNKTVFFETSLIIKLWLEKTTLAHTEPKRSDDITNSSFPEACFYANKYLASNCINENVLENKIITLASGNVL